MIMTELDSCTFFHAQSRIQSCKPPKSGVSRVVHENGPRTWGPRFVVFPLVGMQLPENIVGRDATTQAA